MKNQARAPRIRLFTDAELTGAQLTFRDALASGPRGKMSWGGPFAAWLHAPEFGLAAQQLGAYCRYHTTLPPRLSEFAILVTARYWRAQYEWYVHAPIAEKQGVLPQTVAELRSGRTLTKAPKDERAMQAFILELYKNRRVSQPTYARLEGMIGPQATVELVGVVGYYALVAMTLDAFEMPLPEGATPPFKEPAASIRKSAPQRAAAKRPAAKHVAAKKAAGKRTSAGKTAAKKTVTKKKATAKGAAVKRPRRA